MRYYTITYKVSGVEEEYTTKARSEGDALNNLKDYNKVRGEHTDTVGIVGVTVSDEPSEYLPF